ncbi:MAG: NADH-quinone oxidoreductase subunit C [Myxococcales bacterium]|nr:MAG: NADH-quinone oxidoreductase subunit C [Myxococcales bacterium]
MSKALQELVQRRFGAAVLAATSQFGDETLIITAASWVEVHAFLRDDPGAQMNMLIDMCAVDYPDREPRFEVVTHLLSLSKHHRIRIKVQVGDSEGDGAELGTLTKLWGCADWFEREVFDMMGVTFKGHPDLRRILLYPEFEGHPLRRDYDANKTQPLMPYREGRSSTRWPRSGATRACRSAARRTNRTTAAISLPDRKSTHPTWNRLTRTWKSPSSSCPPSR